MNQEKPKPKPKVFRTWIDGDDPGVGIFEVDPPLLPGEIEIDLDDLHDDLEAEIVYMSRLEQVALGDMIGEACNVPDKSSAK